MGSTLTTATTSRVCGTASPLPEWMACFRGTCNRTTLECECLPGWDHDTTLARFGNCAMPSVWIPLVLGLTGFGGLVVALLLALHLRDIKGESRRAVQVNIFTQVMHAASCVAFVASGYYASGWFWLFQGLAIEGVFATVVLMFGAFFRVASRALHVPLPERRLNAAFALMFVAGSVPLLVGFIGSFVLGADGDPVAFNDVIIYGVLATLPLHELTAVPVFASIPLRLVRIATDITRNVQANVQRVQHGGGSPPSPTAAAIQDDPQNPSPAASTNTSNGVTDFVRRLKLFHVIIIRLIVPVITGFMYLIVALYAAFGQVPFQWLVFFFIITMHLGVSGALYVLTVRKSRIKVSGSAPKSPRLDAPHQAGASAASSGNAGRGAARIFSAAASPLASAKRATTNNTNTHSSSSSGLARVLGSVRRVVLASDSYAEADPTPAAAASSLDAPSVLQHSPSASALLQSKGCKGSFTFSDAARPSLAEEAHQDAPTASPRADPSSTGSNASRAHARAGTLDPHYKNEYVRDGFAFMSGKSRAMDRRVRDLNSDPIPDARVGEAKPWSALVDDGFAALVATANNDAAFHRKFEREGVVCEAAPQLRRGGIDLTRLRGVLKVSPEELMACMYSLPTVGSFDASFLYARVLHHFQDHRTILTHSCNAVDPAVRAWPLGKGPFVKRDFIDLISYRRVDADTYLMLDVGVPSAFGPCQGCVRGEVVQFGYVISRVPVGDPADAQGATSWSRVTMINQTLAKGWLPTAAANALAGGILLDYMLQYEAAAIEARRDGRMPALVRMWGGAE